jgi:ethanolamine ammonia-lyase small subunit
VADSTPSRPAAPLPAPGLQHPARLSLGNSNSFVATHEHLRFQLDHALARDAVHTPLDIAVMQRGLTERGLHPIALSSAVSATAKDKDARRTYLLRPDLGRTLHPDSVATLQSLAGRNSVILSEGSQGEPQSKDPEGADPTHTVGTISAQNLKQQDRILFLLADGLSALALERHALPLLDATLPLLSSASYPLVPVLTHARVAIADEIGALLHAQLTVLLIGERPGLSSPDSLGVYLTWDPRPGRTDAERNCISNIRGADGLSYAEAAHRIAHYITEARRLHTTGVALKDPATTSALPQPDPLQ